MILRSCLNAPVVQKLAIKQMYLHLLESKTRVLVFNLRKLLRRVHLEVIAPLTMLPQIEVPQRRVNLHYPRTMACQKGTTQGAQLRANRLLRDRPKAWMTMTLLLMITSNFVLVKSTEIAPIVIEVLLVYQWGRAQPRRLVLQRRLLRRLLFQGLGLR